VDTKRLDSPQPHRGQVAGSSDLDIFLSNSNLCEQLEHLYSYSGTPSTSLAIKHMGIPSLSVLYTTVFSGVKFLGIAVQFDIALQFRSFSESHSRWREK